MNLHSKNFCTSFSPNWSRLQAQAPLLRPALSFYLTSSVCVFAVPAATRRRYMCNNLDEMKGSSKSVLSSPPAKLIAQYFWWSSAQKNTRARAETKEESSRFWPLLLVLLFYSSSVLSFSTFTVYITRSCIFNEFRSFVVALSDDFFFVCWFCLFAVAAD